jgi:class 3 adenylate cyclase/TolB-like protein/ketosteroid isomerase-like protein
MEPDNPFTRRVCAVLLADVTGFSKLMGEDDERTARAVHHLQAMAQGIVSEAGGRAEPVAGDALFATFDSVVAAVSAAITIQLRLAEEQSSDGQLQVRIGIHVGDVLMRDGRAFGDAINIAARLEAQARPGTICISDTVYRQVRNKFDARFTDLGALQLKNISDPVHAYLLDPHTSIAAPSAGRTHPTRSRWMIGAAAIAGVAAVVAVVYSPRTTSPPRASPLVIGTSGPHREAVKVTAAQDGPVGLGVMLFKSPTADTTSDWRREALRDGLNTQLSQLSQVKVYSKEFLDFLVTRKGLSEVEAATQLGIKKMLSGTFVSKGGTLRIETHVVDVTTGVLEASYTTSGKEGDFLDLQNQVGLEIISRLNLPVTESEKQALFAKRNTNEDALMMLLEAEGGGASPPADSEGKPAASAPRSSLPRWLAALAPVAAYGQTPPETQIRDVIEHYRRATEAHELDALAALHSQFSAEQRAAQQRYFDNVKDLKVAIENVDIAVVGDEAVVSYTRTDDFADAKTGRPMHASVRITKTLRQDQGAWKLAGGK